MRCSDELEEALRRERSTVERLAGPGMGCAVESVRAGLISEGSCLVAAAQRREWCGDWHRGCTLRGSGGDGERAAGLGRRPRRRHGWTSAAAFDAWR